MNRLDAAGVLDLWETGRPLHPLDRAVLLASVALPEHNWDAVADLPVGVRDTAILRLRRIAVGDELGATLSCPTCGEIGEIHLSVESLLEQGTEANPTLTWGPHVHLPSSRDLAAALRSDPQWPARALAARCLSDDAPQEIDEAVITQLSEWVAGNDPLAEIRLALVCHGCARQWDEVLDPPSFFWREIEARAFRLLDEVDRLARAYGWSERDVLSLGELRRAAYLERVT